MSVVISSHNLAEFEILNFDLSVHSYALQLLDHIPDEQRGNEFSRLLTERLSLLSDTVLSFKLLERCIRGERDFNADSSCADSSSDVIHVCASCQFCDLFNHTCVYQAGETPGLPVDPSNEACSNYEPCEPC